jgi:phosphoglycolate phosphatase (TIGR01487 family)
MRYLALACDYDGTIAHHGTVDSTTIQALERLKSSGRKLILVTGRQIPDLENVFPQVSIFDVVVGENGAVLYFPPSRTTKILADQPPQEFVKALIERKIEPLSIGDVIVATWHPNETAVIEVIRDLGLELQIIFNKGAVMVLPSGVNKASGLQKALKELKLSPHNVVGVGDAENDHAFLKLCECSVAVANALESIKTTVDFVTQGDHGKGVEELIELVVKNDLIDLEESLKRHEFEIGKTENGDPVRIRCYRSSVLIAGTSGSGKSTLATLLLERMLERNLQFNIIDPEGDYESFERAVVFGDSNHDPRTEEVMTLIENDVDQNAIVNLLGVNLEDRPTFFENFFPHLLKLRVKYGRPHWIVIDETHHLLPEGWDPSVMMPQELFGIVMITVHPNHVSKSVLRGVETLIVIGREPQKTIALFSERLGQKTPKIEFQDLATGEAILWEINSNKKPFLFFADRPKTERKRHSRKYAEGELPAERSFYFRGSEGKLKLRAENLNTFLKLAEGVDDNTWQYHLDKGDYSCWFREMIKDEVLAAEAAKVEKQQNLSPEESKSAIREAIEKRYTAPA